MQGSQDYGPLINQILDLQLPTKREILVRSWEVSCCVRAYVRAYASNPPPFFFHVPQLTCVRAQQTNFVNKAFGEVLETLGQLDLEKFEV